MSNSDQGRRACAVPLLGWHKSYAEMERKLEDKAIPYTAVMPKRLTHRKRAEAGLSANEKVDP